MREQARRMLRVGVLLFLLGLLTGALVPALAVPRLGLSAHVVGVLSGLLLVVLGIAWPQLRLSSRAAGVAFWFSVYGCYGGWLMPLLGGIWGAGAAMMPMAAGSARGTALQEGIIGAGLFSSALALVAVCALLLWGLRSSSES
jgi:hydroxylaminobenzene mutase